MKNLDVGSVYSRIFDIYGSQFLTLIGGALIINLISALLSIVITGSAGLLLLLIVGLVLGTLYAGMVVKLVQDLEDGRRDSSFGELFSSVTPVVAPLIGVSLLAGIGVAIGFVLLIAPGLFLLTIWAVVAPVVVVEKAGLSAFGRSQELVKGNGWPVFGCIVIAFLLSFVASLVGSAIASAIGGDVGLFIGGWILPAVTAPITALVSAVIYFSLRGWGAPEAPTGLPVT